jgi:hypothetical protein
VIAEIAGEYLTSTAASPPDTVSSGFRFQIVSWGWTAGWGSSALTGAAATLVKASCRWSSLAVR